MMRIKTLALSLSLLIVGCGEPESEPVTELTIIFESGLQSLDPGTFSGPAYEKLTGIKVNVIEAGDYHEIGEYLLENDLTGVDVVSMPVTYYSDVHELFVPLDERISTPEMQIYMNDIHQAFRSWGRFGGVTYGLPDDGDVLTMMYNKKLLAGYGVPESWDEYIATGKALTEAGDGTYFGVAPVFGEVTIGPIFENYFCNAGGEWFDIDSMKSGVGGDAGRIAMERIIEEGDNARPDTEERHFVAAMADFQGGNAAMMNNAYPPFGRWAEGYAENEEAMTWVPPSKVKGIVGHAPIPEGASQLGLGYALSILKTSDKQEEAWKFIKWMNGPEHSLERVMLGFALRDPFRYSHFDSEVYQNLFPSAVEYLEVHDKAATTAMPDLMIYRKYDYFRAMVDAANAVMNGGDIDEELQRLNTRFDQITEYVGVIKQRRAYMEWLRMPNACRP